MPEPIESLEAQRRRLMAELAQIGDMRHGSITEVYWRCGKPSCWCQRTDQPGHGPFYAVTTKVKGKYQEMRLQFQVRVTNDWFFQAWNSIFNPTANVRADFLRELARHYTLVLVSHTNDAHLKFVKQGFPLFQAFHHFILSYQVGMMKPDTKIYRAAIKSSGVRAHETFYADDVEEYVDASRLLGLRSERVQSRKELVEQLAAYGICMPEDSSAC